MYDIELEEIFNEDDEFASRGRGKYQYVDISCTLAGDVVKIERDALREDKIKDWATRKSQPDPKHGILNHLRIFCMEVDDSEEESNATLPFTRTAYDSIKEAWNLPDWTIRFLDDRYSNSLVVPYGALTASKYLKKMGLAVKNAQEHKMFTFYDPDQRTTFVVLYGIVVGEHETDFTANDILDRVEKCQEVACLPILTPLLFVEGMAKEVEFLQSGQQRRMENVERKQAFYPFDERTGDSDSSEDAEDGEEGDGNENDEEEAGEEEDDEDELVGYTREFTKLWSLSRALQRFLEDVQQSAAFLQQMHQLFIDGLESVQQKEVGEAWHNMYERLLFVERQMLKRATAMGDNQQEIQQSIQTIYALIGTNDSRLNYETAQASVRIAEDSRRVAILTRQDSTDMRVIAVTTLLFLPATFVATLFSSDFFNFQPSTGLVSRWIWLYFAVTTGLTAAVMLAWRMLSRQREKETAQILRLKEDDKRGGEEQEKVEGEDQTVGSLASGNAIQELRDRLSKRKKTPTMEMEEK